MNTQLLSATIVRVGMKLSRRWLATLLTAALLPSVWAANTPPRFTAGPDQTVLEDSGPHSVAGWASGISPHSIVTTPIAYSSDFTAVPAGGIIGGNARVDAGILKLTDAINSQTGSFATPPVLQRINSFTATFNVLVGGGTCCGDRTADGWSLSFGDIALPITFPVAAEEGAGSDLVLSFDSWDNGGLDDGFSAPNLDVKSNGTIVAYQAFDGVREGGRAPDGPFVTDPATGLPMSYKTGLAFVPVRVHLDPDGTLDVDFKGVRLVNNVSVGPRELENARLVFGARTGGANDNHWIDDLSIIALPVDSSGDEAGQTVQFHVGNNNPGLFSVQPAISPDGTLTYTPAPNANGSALVSVVAQDNGGIVDGGNDSSAPVMFTINVTPVNDCPTANSQSISVNAGASVNFQLSGSDVDGDGLTYNIAQGPAHGSVVIQTATGAATYTPSPGYTGPDSFTFSVSDGPCVSAAATVTVTVGNANACPAAVGAIGPNVELTSGQTETVVIAANGVSACLNLDGTHSTDPDGDALTYAWVLVLSDGSTVPLAVGATATACLDVGSYTVRLLVDDGVCVNTADARVEIMTASDAIGVLIDMINESTLGKNKRPLVAILSAASASFDRGNCDSARGQLGAFTNMVRARVTRTHWDLAADLIQGANGILGQACPDVPKGARGKALGRP